jgi:spermidine synthase
VRRHLRPGGVLFYNTTESQRALRTGCAVFADGMRIEHFLAVGDSAFQPNAEGWRKALADWRIDGRPVLDLGKSADRQRLDDLVGRVGDLDNPAVPAEKKYVERCTSVLSRTAGRTLITDDNMGTEWRANLGFAP